MLNFREIFSLDFFGSVITYQLSKDAVRRHDSLFAKKIETSFDKRRKMNITFPRKNKPRYFQDAFKRFN